MDAEGPRGRAGSMSKVGREHWVDDSEVTACYGCSVAFGLVTRKHHCRSCGKIFCSKCLDKMIAFTPSVRKAEEGYTEKRKKVCDACYKRITEARKDVLKAAQTAAAASVEAEKLRRETLQLRKAKEEIEIERDSVKAQLQENEMQALTKQAELEDQLYTRRGEVPSLKERITVYKEQVEQMRRELDEVDTSQRIRRGSKSSVTSVPEEGSEPGQPGVYLIFEPIQYGTMFIVWSKTRIEGALARGEPGKEVPEFKYDKGGKSELCRELARDKQNYYKGWSMFMQTCHQFKCTVVDYGKVDDSAPIPAAVWLHYREDRGVKKVLPSTPFTTAGVDVIAVAHSDSLDLDVPYMDRELFVQKCTSIGEYVAIDEVVSSRTRTTSM